jgi:hypothetical protein
LGGKGTYRRQNLVEKQSSLERLERRGRIILIQI